MAKKKNEMCKCKLCQFYKKETDTCQVKSVQECSKQNIKECDQYLVKDKIVMY